MAQIYELIGKAMNDIGAIGKDDFNSQQKYKFRGIDAVMNALNPVMRKYGLFCTPEVLNQVREERATTTGGTLKYSLLTVKYTVYAPDGSTVCATVIGEGMDSGDKASNKALSVAFKYAMFQLFCIPTEEFVDSDTETPPENKPVKEPEKKQAKPNEAKPAKDMKTLMEKAMLAYGMDHAKERFDMLLNRAECTIRTMTEEKYDMINGWILEDIRNNAKGAA